VVFNPALSQNGSLWAVLFAVGGSLHRLGAGEELGVISTSWNAFERPSM
jgi:hypothetical protein